jgi:hypothetical protein
LGEKINFSLNSIAKKSKSLKINTNAINNKMTSSLLTPSPLGDCVIMTKNPIGFLRGRVRVGVF